MCGSDQSIIQKARRFDVIWKISSPKRWTNSKSISRIITLALVIIIIAIAGGAAYYFISTFSTTTTPSSTSTESSCTSRSIDAGTPYMGAIAYDPSNGYIYASTKNGMITINSSGNTITDNVSLGFDPSSISYNPGNGMIYATDLATGRGAVFDPNSGNATNLGFNEFPYSTPNPASYNPALNVYYSSGSYLYYIVNASSNSLIDYFQLGTNIQGMTYDQSNQILYIANLGNNTASGSVYAVKPGNDNLVANVTKGAYFGPSGIALDTSNGYLYVTDIGSDYLHTLNLGHGVIGNVSIIDTKTNTFVKTLTVGFGMPRNPIYVEKDSRVYFFSMNYGGGASVLGINDKTNTIAFNVTVDNPTMNIPTGMTFDPQNGCLYLIGNAPSGTVNIVTVPTD